MAELADLKKLLCRSVDSRDPKAFLDVLNHIKYSKLRCPRTVWKHAQILTESHIGNLGDEKWDVIEQTCLAALDLGQPSEAEHFLRKLKLRWKNSTRVQRLEAMVLEAKGQYQEAELKYEEMLKANPANTLASKRLVSICRARGKTDEAIKRLTEHLKIFSADNNCWLEMASLHLTSGRVCEASFSYEEMILADPYNYLLHSKYAELLYTIGGLKKLRASRRHFIQSVHFKKKMNARATLGACMCATAIRNSNRSKDEDHAVNEAVHAKASKALIGIYKEGGAPEAISTALKNILG